MLHIAIVEDEEIVRTQEKEYIERYSAEHQLDIKVTEFKSGEAALTCINYNHLCRLYLILYKYVNIITI